MGSPLRRGPALTSLGHLAVKLRNIVAKRPSHQVRKDLESDTGVLAQLLQDFSATAIAEEFRLQIRCFYELRTSKKRGFEDFVSTRSYSRNNAADFV